MSANWLERQYHEKVQAQGAYQAPMTPAPPVSSTSRWSEERVVTARTRPTPMVPPSTSATESFSLQSTIAPVQTADLLSLDPVSSATQQQMVHAASPAVPSVSVVPAPTSSTAATATTINNAARISGVQFTPARPRSRRPQHQEQSQENDLIDWETANGRNTNESTASASETKQATTLPDGSLDLNSLYNSAPQPSGFQEEHKHDEKDLSLSLALSSLSSKSAGPSSVSVVPPQNKAYALPIPEEDREMVKAREAALYAQELLAQQVAEKRRREATGNKKQQAGGPLGILPMITNWRMKPPPTETQQPSEKSKKDAKSQDSSSNINSSKVSSTSYTMDQTAVSSWIQRQESPSPCVTAPTATNSVKDEAAPPAWARPSTTAASTMTAGSTEDGGVPAWARPASSSTNQRAYQEQYGRGCSSLDRAAGTTSQAPPGKGASVLGATALAATVGAITLGPLAAVVAAGGAAYAAGTQTGIVGNAVRGAGTLVAKVASSASSKRDDDDTNKPHHHGVWRPS